MEKVLEHIISIGIFTIVLSVMIVVHEWGHFVTAKFLGVRVDKFSLGFGKKLVSKVWHGTEFIISAIPLGGYVKTAGEDRESCTGQPYEFYSQSPGRRALIAFNGPLVNLIFAYFAFIFVFMLGYPDLSTTIKEVLDDYPAKTAGLQAGDTIKAIDGKPVENWTELTLGITESQSREIAIRVQRGEEILNFSILPKIEKATDIFKVERETRLIGIRPAEEIITLRYGFIPSMGKAFQKIVEIVTMTYKALYYIIFGTMSPKEAIAGPVGIYAIVKVAAEAGFSHLLYVVGVISTSLAICNLFPIWPLDGGLIFLCGVEKIRGRALPKKVDEVIARIGFTLIILLALYVFYTDFSRMGVVDWIKDFFVK